ncbi:MAG: aldehyde dehydrogenase family protein [Phycisphaeraceae bacterium]|nr:MAG: aldehyde dehydrogenase family protein [Phycisphaeraceae bacterium]
MRHVKRALRQVELLEPAAVEVVDRTAAGAEEAAPFRPDVEVVVGGSLIELRDARVEPPENVFIDDESVDARHDPRPAGAAMHAQPFGLRQPFDVSLVDRVDLAERAMQPVDVAQFHPLSRRHDPALAEPVLETLRWILEELHDAVQSNPIPHFLHASHLAPEYDSLPPRSLAPPIPGAGMALFSRRTSSKQPVRHEAPAAHEPEAPARDSARSGAARPDETRIRALGEEMLAHARSHKTGFLTRQFWSDKLMDWSMKDHNFKVQLFRFVDAFPTLTTPEMVHDHLVDYLSQPGVKPPPGMDLGLKAGGVAKRMFAGTISSQIKGMAHKFIAGTDAESALPGLKKYWNEGVAFSVDLLGEACVSDAEADMYQRKYMDLVGNLPDTVASWKRDERLERDHLGDVPRVNVSIKISALSARSDPIDTEGSIRDIMTRIVPILELARDKGVFINFDMEQYQLKDLTIELFKRCCEQVDFHAGIAMQAYLRSGDDDARNICEWSRRANRVVTVRLVKGAYWDYETIHAEQQGWPCPVWSQKRDTDACFERMSEIFLDAAPRKAGEPGVKLALGSHNVRSIAAGLEGLERRGLPREAIELQMLHGMAEELKSAAADMGLRLREYVPVGEMIPGMAYLVRRLLENTSNESWLRAGFLDDASTETLLASPFAPTVAKTRTGSQPQDAPPPDRLDSAPERHMLSPAIKGVGDERPFYTDPPRDFAHKSVRDTFAKAIAGATVPRVENSGTVEDAKKAVDIADAYAATWRDTDPRARAAVLTKAAAIMRERRDGLSGVIIRENGKPWREADADVCEAIDFCEYYARMAVPLFERTRLGRFIGELDETWHQPRGVTAVISPWNFPLAICCGMTTAALVTGNTVVVKPAEQTPAIASIMADILYEAGCPREALQFLPGPGETVGAALVRDPRIALIAFTGSKAVGLDIIQAAGVTPEEQLHVKKVVCEMGGKNAIIVDASADLDEAVLGVRQSAFGFQGQKCSACSRVIVLESAYDLFLERLVESTRSLVIGDPIEPGTDVGPVIDADAAEKIRSYIELGKKENRLALGVDVPAGLEEKVGKPFVGPHIFADVRPEDRIARDEIFGPVLAVIRAKDFDEALRIANNSPYKLTGGVFSRKPANLARARTEFRVGNLYLNRTITGALVGRQPFGGFGMSGVGSKAGGADYLLQFVEPRACSENTMRRGFAPEL